MPVAILVVDDEADMEFLLRQRFRNRLASGELELFYAPNGSVALDCLEAHPEIALVLTDIRMPEMTGLELLARIYGREPALCAIVISAYHDMSNIRAAMNLGAYDFLTKPLNLTDLDATLHKAIAHIREQRAMRRALANTARQYRMLAEKVGDGLAVIQRATVVFANAALCAMLATPAEGLMAIPPDLFLAGTAPEADAPSGWHCRPMLVGQQERWLELHADDIVWQMEPARLLTVRDVTARVAYERRLEALAIDARERARFGDIIGASAAMQTVYTRITRTAASDDTVLIHGESGTGKELIARAIHRASDRRDAPFVVVNCGAVPDALFEREFFGARKGAFTGAHANTPGFFEAAHGGILFLDEVGELSQAAQVKLLRALQHHEVTPLGSPTPVRVDVRILAATNRPLDTLISAGVMRADFFYRICVATIDVPPLRDRKDDLPLLVTHLLRHANLTYEALPAEVVRQLHAHTWPGNVRELQNVLARYATLNAIEFTRPATASAEHQGVRGSHPPIERLQHAVEAFEKQHLLRALEAHAWHRGRAARALGISVRTLNRRLLVHNILPPDRAPRSQ